jgi:glucose/arabinose dehydrogenase
MRQHRTAASSGLLLSLAASILFPTSILAQSSTASCGPAPSGSVRPAAAPGYSWQVVSSGLQDPRGITFDSEGRLLVVERGAGRVRAYTYREDGDCVVEQSREYVTEQGPALNHGIEVDREGGVLYASTNEEVLAWEYNAQSGAVASGDSRTVVDGMGGGGHSTRTLLLTRKEGQTGHLVVSFGSMGNLDEVATRKDSGSSSVKAFQLGNNTNNAQAYDYPSTGTLLGWGLRNEVGVAEHPNSGGIWGVENSADQLSRYGVDVHDHNPGEEMNFLGYLNGTETLEQGSNFGYPWCFSAWDVSELPENGNLTVGTQFAIDSSSALGGNRTDEYCAEQTRSRLVFESHMAPLDLKFNDTGRQGWISFHGSWNSPDPVGYKLSLVDFSEAGEPVDSETSTTAAKDVFFNEDISRCDANCFRPVALAIDGQGRIFMSSDSTGEIYMIKKVEGGNGGPTASGAPAGSTASQTSSPSGTSSGGSSSSTPSGNGCGHASVSTWWMLAAPLVLAMLA